MFLGGWYRWKIVDGGRVPRGATFARARLAILPRWNRKGTKKEERSVASRYTKSGGRWTTESDNKFPTWQYHVIPGSLNLDVARRTTVGEDVRNTGRWGDPMTKGRGEAMFVSWYLSTRSTSTRESFGYEPIVDQTSNLAIAELNCRNRMSRNWSIELGVEIVRSLRCYNF